MACCKSFELSRYHCKLLKRFLLITVLLPFVAGIPYTELIWARSVYYIIFTTGIATYALLLNFPSIVSSVHSRPLYYGDLIDDKYVDPTVRRRFQYLFIFILQITLTLISSGLIYYYYDAMHESRLSNIEMAGVVGGFVSLLLKIENVIGKVSLSLLNFWKSRIINSTDATAHERNIKRMRTNSLAIFSSV